MSRAKATNVTLEIAIDPRLDDDWTDEPHNHKADWWHMVIARGLPNLRPTALTVRVRKARGLR